MSEFSIPGLLPGEIASYDDEARTCRVRIPGITDGSSVLPVAVFSNPIGDRAVHGDSKSHTEIRILEGDPVWLMFEAGDPRFPIIMGYRTPREGNPTNWRRWRHANIEMTADGDMVLNCTNLILNATGDVTEHIGGNHKTDIGGKKTTDVTGAMESTAQTSTHQATTHELTALTTITGGITTRAGLGANNFGVEIEGPLLVRDGEVVFNNVPSITHDGVPIDKNHVHAENDDGGPTDPPQ